MWRPCMGVYNMYHVWLCTICTMYGCLHSPHMLTGASRDTYCYYYGHWYSTQISLHDPRLAHFISPQTVHWAMVEIHFEGLFRHRSWFSESTRGTDWHLRHVLTRMSKCICTVLLHLYMVMAKSLSTSLRRGLEATFCKETLPELWKPLKCLFHWGETDISEASFLRVTKEGT